MAIIKNPTIIGGGVSNAKLTVTTTLTTPPSVKAYLQTVLTSIPEIQEGKFFALNKRDWYAGSTYKLAMFTVEDGALSTENGVTVDTTGKLLLRVWTTATNMRVSAGDVFEFIKVDKAI